MKWRFWTLKMMNWRFWLPGWGWYWWSWLRWNNLHPYHYPHWHDHHHNHNHNHHGHHDNHDHELTWTWWQSWRQPGALSLEQVAPASLIRETAVMIMMILFELQFTSEIWWLWWLSVTINMLDFTLLSRPELSWWWWWYW